MARWVAHYRLVPAGERPTDLRAAWSVLSTALTSLRARDRVSVHRVTDGRSTETYLSVKASSPEAVASLIAKSVGGTAEEVERVPLPEAPFLCRAVEGDWGGGMPEEDGDLAQFATLLSDDLRRMGGPAFVTVTFGKPLQPRVRQRLGQWLSYRVTNQAAVPSGHPWNVATSMHRARVVCGAPSRRAASSVVMSMAARLPGYDFKVRSRWVTDIPSAAVAGMVAVAGVVGSEHVTVAQRGLFDVAVVGAVAGSVVLLAVVSGFLRPARERWRRRLADGFCPMLSWNASFEFRRVARNNPVYVMAGAARPKAAAVRHPVHHGHLVTTAAQLAAVVAFPDAMSTAGTLTTARSVAAPTAVGDTDGAVIGVDPHGMVVRVPLAHRTGGIFVSGDPRTGKALALDTRLRLADGSWTTMGEVGVGDLVAGPFGPVKVVAATEVMVGRPCWRLLFSDGEVVVADEEHLWMVGVGAGVGLVTTGDLARSGVRYLPGMGRHDPVGIDSVERVGSVPVRCIQVTAGAPDTMGVFDGMFTVGDRIPTHNSTLLLNVWKSDLAYRPRHPGKFVMLWWETKGECHDRALRAASDLGYTPSDVMVVSAATDDGYRLELVDRARPIVSSRMLVEAMQYSLDPGDIRGASMDVLQVTLALACSLTADEGEMLGYGGLPNVIQVAFDVLGGRPTTDAQAVLTGYFRTQAEVRGDQYATMVESWNRYMAMKESERNRIIEPARNKLSQFLVASSLWQPGRRPAVSFRDILEGDRVVVLRFDAAGAPSGLVEDLSSMAFFLLWQAVRESCVGWDQAGNRVHLYADEVDHLAGKGSGGLDVATDVFDKGGFFGFGANFGTQRIDKLPAETAKAMLSFSTKVYLAHENDEVAQRAAQDLTGGRLGSFATVDIRSFPKLTGAVRMRLGDTPLPPFTVEVPYETQLTADDILTARHIEIRR